MKPRLRLIGYLVAFALGGSLGTLWDQLHVRSVTLTYAHPTLLGQPWWVPIEFGFAAVLLVWLTGALGDPVPRSTSPHVAMIEVVWFTGIYACTAFFDRKPWIVFILLAVGLIVRRKDIGSVADRNVIPAIALVVLGPLTEAMLIEAGMFSYRTSQAGPIPAWLPLLYASGFLFVLRATEALMQRFGVRRMGEPEPETAVADAHASAQEQ